MVAGLLVLLTASAAAVAHSALRDGGAVRRAGPIGTASLGAAAAVVVLLLFVLVVRGAGALGDRSAYWHAALVDYRAHPLLGSGPGSFADAWVRYRTVSVATLNAHSLYLETLAELGPLGLALIVVLLSMPLTAIAAGRHRHPFTAPAAGAYVAFLVHAGVDWDWQMPAVTVSALICAIALLASARSNESSPTKPVAVAASVAASLAAAAVMGLALVGNIALSRAGSAARTTSWADSIRLAQSAARWQPWSAEPKLILGEAELSAGKPRAARRSFERAVQLAPQNWQVWYELGRVAPARRGLAARSLAALDPLLVMRVRTSTR
jgi:cytochrome c-type biogenesis protein CcmH/NrfG